VYGRRPVPRPAAPPARWPQPGRRDRNLASAAAATGDRPVRRRGRGQDAGREGTRAHHPLQGYAALSRDQCRELEGHPAAAG